MEEETTDLNPRHDRPGVLRSETTMTIQTHYAQNLVNGRKRRAGVEPIIGLLDFGRRMKLVWLSAQSNDPYADWFLVKIETSIQETQTKIKHYRELIENKMAGMQGFQYSFCESSEPINIPLNFPNPYGYMGAYLLADYDQLVRELFTARHVGLLDRKQLKKTNHEIAGAIRHTLLLAMQWTFTGVVREDIEQGNQNAQRAIDKFGECPQDILDKTQRASMAPEIKLFQREVEEPVSDDLGEVDAEGIENDTVLEEGGLLQQSGR